jgi:hypothetical protein
MNMRGLFAELKRRKVWDVGLRLRGIGRRISAV